MNSPSLPGDTTAAVPATTGPEPAGRLGGVWAGVAGVTSAAAGLASGHLVAAWINPAASPLVAVGAVVVDLTPTPLKEWAATTFGTADKVVLLVGIAVVVAALAFWAGLLAVRRPRGGLAVAAILGAVAVAAALSRPGADRLDWLPGLVTTLVGAAALTGQRRWLSSPPGGGGRLDRRRFLLGTAGLLAGSAGLAALGQRLGGPPVPETPLVLPEPVTPLPALPAGVEGIVPGISPLRTPTPDFYRIDIALTVPRIDPQGWRLSVEGLVAQPFTLTFGELLALPMIERDITLTCVSNPIGGPYCGSTRWRGVRVADLLRRAGPAPEADMVLSSSPDGFSANTPLPVLLDGRDAMIAIAMDGEPLTAVHGGPARLLTPGLYGYVGATKWLEKLLVTTFAAHEAYWTQRGWAELGPVKTACRIDTPRSTAPAGRVVIGGVAWATHRGVGAVQVRLDAGPWQAATLGPDVGLDYWRQWYLPWDASPGVHVVTARAADASGQFQTEQVAGEFPDGATGYAVASITVA